MTLSHDLFHCWDKIFNCEVALTFQQPGRFVGGGAIDDNGYYMCPRCLDGYYWRNSTGPYDRFAFTSTQQGNCETCQSAISGCIECDGPNFCLKCNEPHFPSYDGCECMSPFLYCPYERTDYLVIDSHYACPKCLEGYFRNDDGGCSPCDIEHCVECAAEDVCLECKEAKGVTHYPSYDGSYCMPEFKNCVEMGQYHEQEVNICVQCKDGYGFSWNEMNCVPCSKAIEGCVECGVMGTCHKCEKGLWPSPDKHACGELIERCEDGPEDYEPVFYYSEEYEMDVSYWKCNNCKDRYFWSHDYYTDKMGCFGTCEYFGYECIDCNHEECLECTEGNFLKLDQQGCHHYVADCEVEFEDQPEYLLEYYWIETGETFFVCPDCEDGKYWDWYTLTCDKCRYENCKECDENRCLECYEPMFLEFNGYGCRSSFENCLIPHAAQPELLGVDFYGYYYCPTCDSGFVWDDEAKMCRVCEDFVENCAECDAYGDCKYCIEGFWKNEDGECDAMEYRNCKYAPDWFGPCQVCMDGYGLNSKNECVSCTPVGEYCMDCSFDKNNRVSECTYCPVNA